MISVFCELLICFATYFITPLLILTSLVGQNIIFWSLMQLQSRGFNIKAIKLWAQYGACWYWKIFSWLWHGHEIVGSSLHSGHQLYLILSNILGLENIPSSGPALLLYYHGAIPVDYYYLVADTFLRKGR